jgi:hypothetical protein
MSERQATVSRPYRTSLSGRNAKFALLRRGKRRSREHVAPKLRLVAGAPLLVGQVLVLPAFTCRKLSKLSVVASQAWAHDRHSEFILSIHVDDRIPLRSIFPYSFLVTDYCEVSPGSFRIAIVRSGGSPAE